MTLQCLGNYTQEVYTQKNKEIFMDIYTGFIPPIYFITPPVQKHSGPTGAPAVGNIYTGDK